MIILKENMPRDSNCSNAHLNCTLLFQFCLQQQFALDI